MARAPAPLRVPRLVLVLRMAILVPPEILVPHLVSVPVETAWTKPRFLAVTVMAIYAKLIPWPPALLPVIQPMATWTAVVVLRVPVRLAAPATLAKQGKPYNVTAVAVVALIMR